MWRPRSQISPGSPAGSAALSSPRMLTSTPGAGQPRQAPRPWSSLAISSATSGASSTVIGLKHSLIP